LREGLYVTDADGRILDASPAFAAIVGAPSAADVRGRSIDEFLVDPTARRAAVSTTGAHLLELTVRRADGERRIVLDSARLERDAAGTLSCVGVLADVTSERVLEARLGDATVR